MKNKFRMAVALSLACGAFALTGCNDYESDINAINGRLDALETGRLASAEEQIAALKSSLETAKTAIADLEAFETSISGTVGDLKTKVEGISGDLTGLEGDVSGIRTDLTTLEGTVGTIKTDLGNLTTKVGNIEAKFDDYATMDWANSTFATKEYVDLTFATKDAVEELNTELGTVKGRVATLETQMSDLQTKVNGKLDASIFNDFKIAYEQAMNGTDGVLAKIAAVKTTADKAASDAASALTKIGTLEGSIDGKIDNAIDQALLLYYTKSEVETMLGKKLDADKFQAEFEKAVKESMLAGGALNNAITSALTTEVNNLNTRIDALTNRVDDLAKRIQSLVFVPEYSDGLATATTYTIGDDPVDDMVVNATFQVTPKEYAKYLTEENTYISTVSVKTRAAETPMYLPVRIIENPESALNGYVNVEVRLPIPADGKNASIALYVEDSKKQEAAEGEESVDDGSFVSSSYVGVATAEAVDLATKYVLYKKEAGDDGKDKYTVLNSGDRLNYEVQWIEAPGERLVFEGYQIGLKLSEEENPISLAEAAEKLYLGEEGLIKITPSVTSDVTYAKGGSENWTAESMYSKYIKYNAATTSEGIGADSKMYMNTEEGVEPSRGLRGKAKLTYNFLVGESPVLSDISAVYKIIATKATATLSAQTVDWTYAFALAHAEASADVPAVMTPNALPVEFKVDIQDVDKDKVSDDVLNALTAPNTTKVEIKTGEDEWAEVTENAPVLTVTSVDAAEMKAVVSVAGYDFSNEKETVYRFTNTYTDHAEVALTVTFDVTFGQMPAEQLVNLTEEPMVIDIFTTGAKQLPVSGVEAKALAGVAADFKDAAEFAGALFHESNTVVKATTQNGKALDETAVGFSKLEILAEDASYIRISSSVIKDVKDAFAFKTTVNTWFGVPFVFTADLGFKVPAINLVTSPEYVDANNNVKVKGSVGDDGKYVINNADLSKYVKIEGLSDDLLADNLNKIAIKYTVLTVPEEDKGIINIPVPTNASALVDGTDGMAVSSILPWLPRTGNDYTCHKLEVKAAVTLGGIEIGKEVTLYLATDEVISEIKTTDIAEDRYPKENTVVNMWEGLSVLDLNGVEQINRDAADISNIYVDQQLYDLNVTFGDEVKVYLGTGDNKKLYDYTGKLTFDPATGVLTIIGDDAVWTDKLTFEVTGTVNSVLNHNGVDRTERNFTASVVVTHVNTDDGK